MSELSNNKNSKLTDQYISEYNERLRKERTLSSLNSNVDSESDIKLDLSPSEIPHISNWKNDFGRSLDQLERAFSLKKNELTLLTQEVNKEKKELETLYNFKANISNFNNAIKLLNEKLDSLTNEYEDKKSSLVDEYDSYKVKLENDYVSEKHNYQVLFDDLKQDFESKKSVIDSELSCFEEQMKKKKLFWEDDKSKLLDDIQKDRLLFIEEKESISNQFRDEQALLEFNFIKLNEYYDSLLLSYSEKKSFLESEVNQIQLDYVKKYDDLTLSLNSLTSEVNQKLIHIEETQMLSFEAEFLYKYNKALLDSDLKDYENSAKHSLREQLLSIREDHDKELKNKEVFFLKQLDEDRETMLKEFQQKQAYLETQFDQKKISLEHDKRLEIKKEFDYLLSFEKEKYEEKIKQYELDLTVLKDRSLQSSSAKDSTIAELNESLTLLKMELSKLKVENDTLSDNTRKSIEVESNDRYQTLLHTYQKKYDAELLKSKKMIVSLEQDLNRKSAELVKSNIEIKKLKQMLNQSISSANQTRVFTKLSSSKMSNDDISKPSSNDSLNKVIRANSYESI